MWASALRSTDTASAPSSRRCARGRSTSRRSAVHLGGIVPLPRVKRTSCLGRARWRWRDGHHSSRPRPECQQQPSVGPAAREKQPQAEGRGQRGHHRPAWVQAGAAARSPAGGRPAAPRRSARRSPAARWRRRSRSTEPARLQAAVDRQRQRDHGVHDDGDHWRGAGARVPARPAARRAPPSRKAGAACAARSRSKPWMETMTATVATRTPAGPIRPERGRDGRA
jgi:hypothetical protein